MTTQRAVFNYEEVIDLHTEVGRVSVIGVHTPTGDTPRKLCPGFFEQFKKYKYVGCSISLVPAATLPADPAQVSLGSGGDPEIDARDMLNPVMFHGCHGNDLGNILNRIYTVGQVGGSDLTQFLGSDSLDLMNMADGIGTTTDALDLLESLYYRALTDNTWKKAHIQRGFRKSGLRPRIYSLATNMQIQNAASLGGGFNAPGPFQGDGDALNLEFEDVTDPTVNPIRYFTPRTVPLGWLDTRQVVPYTPAGNVGDVSLADLDDTIKGLVQGKTIWNELPKVFMGVIMLPPAYKTEFYFRMIINHVFAFAGFRGISMSNDMLDMPPTYHDWNDSLSSGDSDEPYVPEPPEPAPVPELAGKVALGITKDDGYRVAALYDSDGYVQGSMTVGTFAGSTVYFDQFENESFPAADLSLHWSSGGYEQRLIGKAGDTSKVQAIRYVNNTWSNNGDYTADTIVEKITSVLDTGGIIAGLTGADIVSMFHAEVAIDGS